MADDRSEEPVSPAVRLALDSQPSTDVLRALARGDRVDAEALARLALRQDPPPTVPLGLGLRGRARRPPPRDEDVP